MTNQNSVSIRKVSKSFADIPALRQIDLEVAKGEFVSLLGPSGCGKTTLLRIIAGLETATSGQVSIGDQDVTRLPPYERNIGLVFQSYALFPHKSVAANIAFGLRYRTRLNSAERSKAISEALALVRLGGYENRRPSQLSGGQQQRVALARAIVTRPEVLLLDEPLSNLDAKLRDEMRFELMRLQRELGITFVYVTHDRIEALSMSDRIAVMQNGVIVQSGPPREIFERPRSVAVADFVGHDNILAGVVESRDGDRAVVRLDEGITVSSPAEASLTAKAQCRLVIPKNTIGLLPVSETGGEGERIKGVVGATAYQGLHVEVQVVLDGGTTLRVEIPTHNAAEIAQGQQVWVDINPAHTWALPNARG